MAWQEVLDTLKAVAPFAWPAAVIYLAGRFGQPVIDLFRGKTIESLKAGIIEVRLSAAEKVVEKATALLPAIIAEQGESGVGARRALPPVSGGISFDGPLRLDELLEPHSGSPEELSGRVMSHAFARVFSLVTDGARMAGVERSGQMLKIIDDVRDKAVISPETAAAVRALLETLQTKPRGEPTPEQAVRFVDLANQVELVLQLSLEHFDVRREAQASDD